MSIPFIFVGINSLMGIDVGLSMVDGWREGMQAHPPLIGLIRLLLLVVCSFESLDHVTNFTL